MRICYTSAMEKWKSDMLSEQEKWMAFARSDAAYDGRFFAAVRSTGIFCRPSCTARTPLRKNVTFYDTAEEALTNGYRPCKRCRPDLLQYKPAEEAAERCRALLEREYLNPAPMARVLKALNTSPGHIGGLFKRQYGMTLVAYRNRLRIEEACRLLRETGKSVTEIAGSCGFMSHAAFYEAFKRHTGTSPQAYRAAETKEEDRI